MTNQERSKSPLEVVEILSDDEITSGGTNSGGRRQSAIEVLDDSEYETGDNDIEIVSEVVNSNLESSNENPNSHNRRNSYNRLNSLLDDDEVEITGHNQMQPPDLEVPDIQDIMQIIMDVPVEDSEASTPQRTRVAVSVPFETRRRPNSPDEVLPRNQRRRRNPPLGVRSSSRFGNLMSMYSPSGSWLRLNSHGHFSFEQSIPATIWENIRRSEEQDMDKRLAKENKLNKKTLDKMKKLAESVNQGYTSTISSKENYVCELCAIVLGKGIPEDFKPDPEYGENIEEYASKLRTCAPWFCIPQCFESDIALLKRVFAAKCGHVFCGRCIKNIGNRQSLKGRKQSKKLDILDPRVSAPRKCPVKDCGTSFMGKKTFTELYL